MTYNRFSSFNLTVLLIAVISVLVTACGTDETPPVKLPPATGITPVNGFFYKAGMGTSNTDNPLKFSVVDKDNNPVVNNWVYFSVIIGDGSFLNDSLKTDSLGMVTAHYNFGGVLGHAEIMAKVKNVDSVTVNIRANMLLPGANGQGQYILFSDHYSDVKDYNGTPLSIDIDPTQWILYANYEASLGVVVVLEDINKDSTAVDSTNVLGVIVNTVYKGKTADSIGIGSTIGDLRNAYGPPDTIKYDPPAPPIYIRYLALGLTIYGDTKDLLGNSVADTIIHEIHLSELVYNQKSLKKRNNMNSFLTESLKRQSSSIYRIYK